MSTPKVVDDAFYARVVGEATRILDEQNARHPTPCKVPDCDEKLVHLLAILVVGQMLLTEKVTTLEERVRLQLMAASVTRQLLEHKPAAVSVLAGANAVPGNGKVH